MVVIRLFLVFSALLVFGALAVYLFTKDKRYLRLAWRLFQFFIMLFVAVVLLYVLERLIFI